MRRLLSRVSDSRRAGLVAATVSVLGAASLAAADPLTLGPIVFPVDTTSIATVVATAIGGIMALIITYKVGFALVGWVARKFLGMKSA